MEYLINQFQTTRIFFFHRRLQFMRKIAASIVLFLSLTSLGPALGGNIAELHFMAFCMDGDGALTEWVSNRLDAYLVGTEHERSRNHRWEIWTRDGGSESHMPVCARLSDGTRPDTVQLENTCNKCSQFIVARINQDGTSRRRELRIPAKKSLLFRKLPNTIIRVEGERNCP
jgi:hypothetical protein